MVVYARADVQGISAVPGCDEQHSRPLDSRTGLPVPVWGLSCPGHEAYICGEGKQKVIEWEPDGVGGFRQHKVSPMDPHWARAIEDVPMTPDQVRAETRRNGLTRRAEQSALQQGVAMALAYDHQPATKELLKARQFAITGKDAVGCPACYELMAAGNTFCPSCGVRVGDTALPVGAAKPSAEPAEA